MGQQLTFCYAFITFGPKTYLARYLCILKEFSFPILALPVLSLYFSPYTSACFCSSPVSILTLTSRVLCWKFLTFYFVPSHKTSQHQPVFVSEEQTFIPIYVLLSKAQGQSRQCLSPLALPKQSLTLRLRPTYFFSLSVPAVHRKS